MSCNGKLLHSGLMVLVALAGSAVRGEDHFLTIGGGYSPTGNQVSLEKNGRFLIGRSLNISATGMLLELDRVLPGEGRLRLHFYLPGEQKPMQMEAEVLRAEFVGTTAKYGLHFADVTEEERDRIEKFVRRLRSRELI